LKRLFFDFGAYPIQGAGKKSSNIRRTNLELPRPLLQGRLLQRYKRFLADIRLDTGEMITAVCPNSGCMLGC